MVPSFGNISEHSCCDLSYARQWSHDGWGAAIAGVLATGAGAAVIAVSLANLWKWGKTRRTGGGVTIAEPRL